MGQAVRYKDVTCTTYKNVQGQPGNTIINLMGMLARSMSSSVEPPSEIQSLVAPIRQLFSLGDHAVCA